MPYNPKFRMQLTFSTGFRNECPGAVHSATRRSALRACCKAIMAILTGRNEVLCSGPPSVYKITIGGMLFSPNFDISIHLTSPVFLKAEDGSVAVNFK